MTCRFWSLALGCLVAGWGVGADAVSRDRVSEWEPTATEAWAESGFRIQLRFGIDSIGTVEGPAAPRWISSTSSPFSFTVEPGVRLSRWFSLSTSLRYALFGDGFRWTNTADLTLHVFHGLQLSVGAGYGGAMGTSCESGAGGLATLTRAAWLFPLGQVFSMGPAVQWEWQHPLRCSEFDEERAGFNFQATSIGWTLAWR